MNGEIHANTDTLDKFIEEMEEFLLIDSTTQEKRTVNGVGSMNAAILVLEESVTDSEKAFDALVRATSAVVRRSAEELRAQDQALSKSY